MKILFATMPFDGHFNPLTGIAMHLKGAGHDVRWYTSSTYEGKLTKLGIPLYSFVKAREVNSENIHELYPDLADIKGVKAIRYSWEKVFLDNIGNHFQDINDIYENKFRFDMFFCDAALYALQLVTELIKTPVFVIGPSPFTGTSKDTPPNFIGLTPARTTLGKKFHQLLRLLMDKMVFTEGMKKFNIMRESFGLQPYNGSFWNIPTEFSKMYFQSGIQEFEYYRSDLSPNIRFVGGLQPYLNDDGTVYMNVEKINKYEKVMLISQGTVDNKDQNKLIIPALDALRDRNYQLIVATGSVNTDGLRKKYDQANIIIDDYVDFKKVLPSTDLYITNGGYGGVIMSLSYGVPLLCAGITAGKNDVNAHVRYFNVGIDLKTDKPSAAKIKKAVNRILSHGYYLDNVKRLQGILKTYNPNDLIESYVYGSGSLNDLSRNSN